MHTNLPYGTQLTYFILGLPRSGTTIVASLFNSLEDGFCLGEPHWYVEAGHDIERVGPDCCGKVAPLWDRAKVSEVDAILPCFIRPAVVIGDYKLGGYKETWRDDPLGRRLLERHIPKVDFFILVHRNGVEAWRSQIRLGWPEEEWTLNRAIVGTCMLYDLKENPKAVYVEIDQFRADPLACLNKALAGRFEIEGPVTLQPTGWVFGDPRANHSTEVQ